MDIKLLKLILKRVGFSIAALFVVTIFASYFLASSGAKSYDANVTQKLSENKQTKAAKERDQNDSGYDPDFYIYHYTEGSQNFSANPLRENYKKANEALKKSQVLAIGADGVSLNYENDNNYSQPVQLAFVFAFFLAAILFFTDTVSNFNNVLFGTRYRKCQIFATKYIIGLFATIIAFTATSLTTFFAYKMAIPEHFKYHLTDLLPSTVNMLGVALVIFTVICAFSALFGGIVPFIIFVVAVVPSFILFLVGLSNILHPLGHRASKASASTSDILHRLAFDIPNSLKITNMQGDFLVFGFFLLVAALFVALGLFIYSRSSAENSGQTIYARGFKIPAFFFLLTYAGIALIPNLVKSPISLVVYTVAITAATYFYIFGFTKAAQVKNKLV
ncbi:MAG: hypothetical protein LBN08_01535 [Lactobacillales bacterium]|jgi:hypothetical protein|nr:hypothetical protein [Lactobacillales bacterium]